VPTPSSSPIAPVPTERCWPRIQNRPGQNGHPGATGLIIEDDYGRPNTATTATPSEPSRDSRPITSSTRGPRARHSPGLRLGWMSSWPDWLPTLPPAKLLDDRGSPVIEQARLADFLAAASSTATSAHAAPRYRTRRDALLNALRAQLPRPGTDRHLGGLHLVTCWLPRYLDRAPSSPPAQPKARRLRPRTVPLSPGDPAALPATAASTTSIIHGVAPAHTETVPASGRRGRWTTHATDAQPWPPAWSDARAPSIRSRMRSA